MTPIASFTNDVSGTRRYLPARLSWRRVHPVADRVGEFVAGVILAWLAIVSIMEAF